VQEIVVVPEKRSTVNVGFDDLAAEILDKLARRTQVEGTTSVHLMAKVADGLVRIQTGARTVKPELEVPKAICKALKDGTVKRFGGVVRNTESGSILKHLKEIKPTQVRKLLKSPMLPFVLLDAAQSALLNEKLAAIQLQLKEIDRKLDAQNQAPLRKAIEQMRDFPYLRDESNRRQQLHHIRESLREFEGIHLSLCDSRWENIEQLLHSYKHARMTNASERKKLCVSARQLSLDLEMIVNAKLMHAQMTLELGERVATEQEMLRLEEFLLNQRVRFHATFNALRKRSAHRTLLRRTEAAHEHALQSLIEPTERLDNLLNSSLFFHLALPDSVASDVQPLAPTSATEESATNSKSEPMNAARGSLKPPPSQKPTSSTNTKSSSPAPKPSAS
jgi:hypothetical protein